MQQQKALIRIAFTLRIHLACDVWNNKLGENRMNVLFVWEINAIWI
jgi:hypothetical protein